jgi:hypothetical protein
MEGSIKIIHKNCDSSLSKDKSLPINSYLVKYCSVDKIMYDIVQGTRVNIFDHYYDEYGKVLAINWTDGRVNPKIYGSTPKKKGK